MEPATPPNMFLGLDIGGTLAKLCIWVPQGVKVNLENLDHLKAPFSKGELTFYKLKVAEIHSVFEILKKLKEDVGFKHLYVTGGGAFKYFNQLQEIHGEYIKDAEISSLLKGLNFLMNHVEDFSFYYRDATGHVPLKNKPDYPFLLINIGSGVSAIKFTSKDEYVRVGGTTLGGGTFLGLSNLLVGTNDFDELLELAKNGKSENADLLIKDIYHGQDSPHTSLSSENLAVSLGKLAMDHLRNVKKVKKEDMVKSFLIMVAFNISQIAYYLAKNNGITQVYFAGNFLRQHTDTMECISYALSYFSAHDGEQINAIFLKHDGFLGALGCTLASAEKENYDITEKAEKKE